MSDPVSKESLSEFNRVLNQYFLYTSKGRKEAVQKQSRNFSFFLSKELRARARKRGEIKSELLDRLRANKPVKVSARAMQVSASRGGGSNMRSAMKVELGLRDSRRMFTASSSRFRGVGRTDESFSVSNGGHQLGRLKVQDARDETGATFEWGKNVSKWGKLAATGLGSASRRTALEKALRETSADMVKYISRKQSEAAKKATRGWF